MNIRLKLVLSAAALAAGCVLLAAAAALLRLRPLPQRLPSRQSERFFRADSFRFR